MWEKKGLLLKVQGKSEWMNSHAQIPTPMYVGGDRYRIFFSTRDVQGRSRPAFADVEIQPHSISVIEVADEPVLDVGSPGTHDDSGVMPFCVIPVGDRRYLYYAGWNTSGTVSYVLSIGLAVSHDGGSTFEKLSEGPLMSRSRFNPYWVAAPCIHYDGQEDWRMWYISCTGWVDVDGKLEPVYLIKHSRSNDGISWTETEDDVAINYKFPNEALGRPWVEWNRSTNTYQMWYSTRGSAGYRQKHGEHYTIGYAESIDGHQWQRMDEKSGIAVSVDGWDSEMICYCAVINHRGSRYLLHNGNGFGAAGFGYAIERQASS